METGYVGQKGHGSGWVERGLELGGETERLLRGTAVLRDGLCC